MPPGRTLTAVLAVPLMLACSAERDLPPEPSSETVEIVRDVYLERLALGLGSPFRLIELAARDPRLGHSDAERLATDLLVATGHGHWGQPDPDALVGRVSHPTVRDARQAAGGHEALQSRAYAMGDPAEVHDALGITYALAVAEGVLPATGYPSLIARSTMERDRRLAVRDAASLFETAQTTGRPVLDVLRAARSARSLESEAPTLQQRAAGAETRALLMVPPLLEAARRLPAAPIAHRGAPTRLGAATATAALDRIDPTHSPPRSVIAIVLGAHLRDAPDTPGVQALRDSVLGEEDLAARWARIRDRGEASHRAAHAVMMATAALRPLAQEPAWHRADPAPGPEAFRRQWGVRSITFDDTVPDAWRPSLRRTLWYALTDLTRALTTLRLDGLSFHFGHGERAMPDRPYLAFHAPTRVIHLPPESFDGTIVHEVAHDLDGQAALRRFGAADTYATAHALQEGDPVLMRALSAYGTPLPPVATRSADLGAFNHGDRPQEIFARSFDWFVAATLAAAGVQNGHLSAIQSEVAPGYGTARTPRARAGDGEAIVDLIGLLVDVPAGHTRHFLDRYGADRVPVADDLVREALDARSALPLPERAGSPASSIRRTPPTRTALEAWRCAVGPESQRPDARAIRAWLTDTAERAHWVRLALDEAYRIGGGNAWHALAANLAGGRQAAVPVGPRLGARLQRLADGIDAPPVYRAPGPLTPPSGCGAPHAARLDRWTGTPAGDAALQATIGAHPSDTVQ